MADMDQIADALANMHVQQGQKIQGPLPHQLMQNIIQEADEPNALLANSYFNSLARDARLQFPPKVRGMHVEPQPETYSDSNSDSDNSIDRYAEPRSVSLYRKYPPTDGSQHNRFPYLGPLYTETQSHDDSSKAIRVFANDPNTSTYMHDPPLIEMYVPQGGAEAEIYAMPELPFDRRLVDHLGQALGTELKLNGFEKPMVWHNDSYNLSAEDLKMSARKKNRALQQRVKSKRCMYPGCKAWARRGKQMCYAHRAR